MILTDNVHMGFCSPFGTNCFVTKSFLNTVKINQLKTDDNDGNNYQKHSQIFILQVVKLNHI